MTTRLVATVGSDAHPFDRMVHEVGTWLAQHAPQVEGTLQYGTSQPPRQPDPWREAAPYLDHPALQARLSVAQIVVTQGGPTGISEARRHGIRPIVMPREASLGEHVDNHQLTFCRLLADRGDIVLVEDTEDLRRRLEEALADPMAYTVPAASDTGQVAQSVERFSHVAQGLSPRRRARIWRARG